MAFINETENRKFVGRKLILDWGKLKLEIAKLPYGDGPNDPVFATFGSQVLLANVYKTKDGQLVDEIIGIPEGHDGHLEGFKVNQYVSDNEFWRAVGEQIDNG